MCWCLTKHSPSPTGLVVELRLDALVFAEVVFSSAGIALPWVTTVGTSGNWLVALKKNLTFFSWARWSRHWLLLPWQPDHRVQLSASRTELVGALGGS